MYKLCVCCGTLSDDGVFILGGSAWLCLNCSDYPLYALDKACDRCHSELLSKRESEQLIEVISYLEKL